MKKLLTILFCITIIFNVTLTAQVPGWSVLNSGTTTHLLGISVVDANIAYACGNAGQILKTTDGGTTWISLPSGVSPNLYPIRFIDALNGIVAGDNGVFLRTTDGGMTWVDLGLNAVTSFRNVYFYNSNIGYAAGAATGNSGVIYNTIDGGATWNPQTISSNSGIYGIMFTSLNDGYCSNFQGTIFTTNDGGLTWNPNSSVSTNTLTDLYFTNPAVGVTVGSSGTILNTIDNGVTWNPVSSGVSDWLAGLEFKNSTDGYIVGGNVTSNTGVMLSSVDGGSSWTTFNTNTSRLTNIDFTSNVGYAVGLDGTIMKYNSAVGISENAVSADLNIFPNPASNIISVSSENFQLGDAEITICDVKGALVYEDCIELSGKTFTVPVSFLNDGMYNMNIQQNSKIFKINFIKN